MNTKSLVCYGVLCCSGLVGCASSPDVNVRYYLPKVKTYVTASQVYTCSSKTNPPVISTNFSINSKYSDDFDHSYFINPHNLDLAIPLINFTLSSGSFDFVKSGGRISSISQTQTGSATSIIQATSAIVEAGVAIGAGASGQGGQDNQEDPVCGKIYQQNSTQAAEDQTPAVDTGNSGSAGEEEESQGDTSGQENNKSTSTSVTLNIVWTLDDDIFKQVLDLKNKNSLKLDINNHAIRSYSSAKLKSLVENNEMSDYLPIISIKSTSNSQSRNNKPVEYNNPCNDKSNKVVCYAKNNLIVARNPVIFTVSSESNLGAEVDEKYLNDYKIEVPQYGTEYVIPLQKASLFGTKTSKVAFSKSGRLTGLSYNNEDSASDASSSVTSLASALESIYEANSDSSVAASIQAKADKLYQTSRYAACSDGDPTTICTAQ